MRKHITIGAEQRSERGKNHARRLRSAGRIPAVIYGAKRDAAPVSVDPRDIDKILYSDAGHNAIFDVSVGDGDSMPAMVVDWQHDPVTDDLLHVDIEWIDLETKLKVKVPVHTTGEPKGVKIQGGVFDLVHREIEVECLPDDIPASFTVDVAGLEIGDNIRARDVDLGGKATLVSSPELVICHVIQPRGAEVAAGAEEEPEEPEEEEKA